MTHEARAPEGRTVKEDGRFGISRVTSSSMRLPTLLLVAIFATLVTSAPSRAVAENADYADFTPIAIAPPPSTKTPAIVPKQAPDLSPWAGLPVVRARVVIEGESWEDVQLPVVKSVRAGEPLTAEVARRAMDEVLATGAFARGEASVRREAGGVVLFIAVTPRKLIQTMAVDLHGAKIERDEVLRESELAEGGEIVGADLSLQKNRIEALFLRHGYPSATVSVTTRPTDDRMKVLLYVDVVPGAERLVEKRWFYVSGAKAEEVRAWTDAYAVVVGARADEAAIAAADADLEGRLRARGWPRATVIHDVGVSSRRLTLRVRVDTGARTEVRFEGNDSYDADALLGALALEDDTDRSASHLADKIRAFYAKRGFYDVEIATEIRGAETDRVRFVVLKITEHARVGVMSRTYPCLKVREIAKLNGGGPASASAIGVEIDSYLEEELPGADVFKAPNSRGVDATIGAGAGQLQTGARPRPIDLDPDKTLVVDTYERALAHVQELYRNEGYLHALVGPLQIVRARCSPKSPPGKCVPLPLPSVPTDQCTYDARNLPLEVPPLGPELTCVPDPKRGIECAPTMQLYVPVKLGPRTYLYDMSFTGVTTQAERKVAAAAQLVLGEPVNGVKLEDARRKISDFYKEEGYAFVDVKYTIESSTDYTRARAHFDVHEGEQVIVKAIVVRGNEVTLDAVIRNRIALTVNGIYRASDVRKTQERLATLAVFSSINVSLQDPYVPQREKVVIIDLVERTTKYIETRGGFSTGEGFRGGLEFGHRNLFGYAVSATLRAQMSYLPDQFIIDPQVAKNFSTLSIGERLARRITLSVVFPDIGLGPTVRTQLDLVNLRDLERDFALTKYSIFGNLIWRPIRQVQISGGQSVELNDVALFGYDSLEAFYAAQQDKGTPVSPAEKGFLRVPLGRSVAFAQRVIFTWDRRDSPFNAHKGTFMVSGVEFVNSYPLPQGVDAQEGHFFRLTQTVAGYIPIGKKVTFAAELRVGQNVQAPWVKTSETYPDRLFFMGGVDSMRGFLTDTFMPQDIADAITAHNAQVRDVPVRGGNLMINPRFELRFPIRPPFDTVLFADIGNTWKDPGYILHHGIPMRASVGSGIRWVTPVGPLVFDYGINVTRRSYEDFGQFHFAIGLF